MGDDFDALAELSAVLSNMWRNDVNAAIVGEDLCLNMGFRTFTGEQSQDKCDSELITYVNKELFEQRESYKRFYDILDNYESAVGVEEVMTKNEITETKKFIDVVVGTF